jgi:hypothetical protein
MKRYHVRMAFGRPTPKDDARAAAYRQWVGARDPFAIASLVLGIFSLIEFGAVLVFGIAGTVLGLLALSRLRRNAEATRPHGHYLAYAGIMTSVISLLIAAKFVYRWI